MASRSSGGWDDTKVIANLVETLAVPKAESFVLEQLSNGNALAHEVLRTLPLAKGWITTFLPPGLPGDSLEKFETGGKLPTSPTSQWKGMEHRGETLLMIPVLTADSLLVAKIRDYLLAGKNHLCVLEDALRKPGDAALARLQTKYAIHNDEIYHLLFHEDAREQCILDTLKVARSIPTFIGAFTRWHGDPLELKVGALSSTQLKALANCTQSFFVGAYDGESYLLWNGRAEEKEEN